jgi:hypothetical protein
MLYLVDGYNVTRADDATRRAHPDEQRLALMRRLAARGRDLLGSDDILVVWDKGPHDDSAVGPVRQVFSLHETADDVIVRIAEQHAGRVGVVTSDRELKDRVRTVAGARTPLLGCSALFEEARPRRRTGTPRPRRDADDGLPEGHASITAELEVVWGDGGDDDG